MIMQTGKVWSSNRQRRKHLEHRLTAYNGILPGLVVVISTVQKLLVAY